jgi:hypothetical protein
MNIRTLLLNMVGIFLVTFIIAALVTYLWNLLRHDLNAVDWDTAFVLASSHCDLNQEGAFAPWIT